MIKHMIKQVCHKYITQAHNKVSTKIARENKKATLSLEAYDLYIFLPFGNKLPKMHSVISTLRLDLQVVV